MSSSSLKAIATISTTSSTSTTSTTPNVAFNLYNLKMRKAFIESEETEEYKYDISTVQKNLLSQKMLIAYGAITYDLVAELPYHSNPEMLRRILRRYTYECDQWLDYKPPNYVNAAIICMNIENMLTIMSVSIKIRYTMSLLTEECIKCCPDNNQHQLKLWLMQDCQSRTSMPYCWCGTYQPQLLKFCSDNCKKQHDEFYEREEKEGDCYE